MNRSKELLELGDEWIKKEHTQETIDGYKERIASQEKLFLAMEDWITRLIKALKEAEADGDEGECQCLHV